jgi:Ricin-type beta-trefoil lectin domain-like
MRRIVGLLFAGTLAAGLGTGMATAAQAATAQAPAVRSVTPVTGSFYEVFPPDITPNAVCSDDPGGSHSIGTLLQIFHCHGSGSDGAVQLWAFVPAGTTSDGDTLYQIENKASTLCMRLASDSGVSGTRIMQDRCLGNADEVWQLHSRNLFLTDPGFQLINTAFGGECLAAANHSDLNGTPLVVHECVPLNLGSPEGSLQMFNLG